MQDIIVYILIGVAVVYTIYSAVRIFSQKTEPPKCGSSCSGCSIKNCQIKQTTQTRKTINENFSD